MTLVLTEDHGPVRHVVLNRPSKALRFSGRLSTTWRTGPWSSVRTRVMARASCGRGREGGG